MFPFHRQIRHAVSALACVALLSTQALASDLAETIRNWEQALDARLGVLLVHPATGWEIAHNADDRFPLNSTFKPLLCAAILSQVDRGTEDLTAQVEIRRKDLVSHSPVTERYIGTTRSLAQLCDAAITRSDNTAANLLLERIGGPEGFTEYMQTSGDLITRLDRWETDLNSATPGDPRDTASPRSVLSTLHAALSGTMLSGSSSAQLADWMQRDQLADDLIRAHLPEGWTIGDKTGAGGHGSRGIIAFLRDPQGHEYLAAIYITETNADFSRRNQAISDIGRAMIAEIRLHRGSAGG
ncbi:class A beta-lactamase [Phaeobacter inhibens]|uniref:class A beta-lactamase n=1 Tax=Phaeobacter inhibens TaxID=221822 RepID=UPI0021A7E4FF|nr:class A beta-lactamase [Phaeobacter inhibens]UWR50069.1 class A beta-lactamase [Phaeobacter inhibens]